MSLHRALSALAIVTSALTLSACGVLVSSQSYGSPTRGHTVSEGASRADVLANLGLPDAVYKADDTEAFLYKGVKGKNYLGLYSSIKRNDIVVVMDSRGIVMTAAPIDSGRGTTWISPPFTDATHPVRTGELLETADNYTYEAEAGGK
jgi:hypothetical protein